MSNLPEAFEPARVRVSPRKVVDLNEVEAWVFRLMLTGSPLCSPESDLWTFDAIKVHIPYSLGRIRVAIRSLERKKLLYPVARYALTARGKAARFV